MALDILAVPPMSDECERLFSSAKLLLTDRRSRLRMEIVEARECLRAWYGRLERKAFDNPDIRLMEGEAGDEVGVNGRGTEDEEEGIKQSGSEEEEEGRATGEYNGLFV
jgi:hAT family C-terminal dimerisation region